jgi:hypothetical protein
MKGMVATQLIPLGLGTVGSLGEVVVNEKSPVFLSAGISPWIEGA